MDLERTGTRFHTTSWSEIAALAATDAQGQRAASARLYQRYWPPLYAHLRASGRGAEEAAAITQDFFEDIVLWRRLLERAEPGRGRLRTYVLVALENYLRDRHRRQGARREGSRVPLSDLEREDGRLSQLGAAKEGNVFDRRWALGLLQEAMRRCEAHFRGGGRETHWALFEARVIAPAVRSLAPRPLAALAAEAGFPSAEAAAAALQTVKRRALMLLREVVAETLSDPSEADDELDQVRRCLLT